MIADNPAARLLAILEAGKDLVATQNCKATWKAILDVPDEKDSLLMSRLGKVMDLPEQVICLVSKNYTNHETIIKYWSTQVDKGFSKQNLQGDWNSFYAHIDSHTRNYLQLTAELIDKTQSTSILQLEDIAKLRSSLDELMNEVISSNHLPVIKEYVARAIQKIIISLDEYRITGALPILESVEGVLGHAFFDNEYKDFISKTDLGQKIVSVLSAVASSVTIVLGLPQIPQQVQLLLEKFSK